MISFFSSSLVRRMKFDWIILLIVWNYFRLVKGLSDIVPVLEQMEASSWNNFGPMANWEYITNSEDGRLYFGLARIDDQHCSVYRSTNFGLVWSENVTLSIIAYGLTNFVNRLSSSSDGKIVVVLYRGNVWISRDSGVTYNRPENAGFCCDWLNIVMSASGQYFYGIFSQQIIYSSNFIDWYVPTQPFPKPQLITCSSNGKYVLVSGSTTTQFNFHAYVALSWDYGYSFNILNDDQPFNGITAIYLSSTAQSIYVATQHGYLWVSNNYGYIWKQVYATGDFYALNQIVGSLDGKLLAAISWETQYSTVYFSDNYGKDWYTEVNNNNVSPIYTKVMSITCNEQRSVVAIVGMNSQIGMVDTTNTNPTDDMMTLPDPHKVMPTDADDKYLTLNNSGILIIVIIVLVFVLWILGLRWYIQYKATLHEFSPLNTNDNSAEEVDNMHTGDVEMSQHTKSGQRVSMQSSNPLVSNQLHNEDSEENEVTL